MNSIPWKRLVPVLAALILFYVLSLVYFSPMLEGKQLSQHDIKQWMGMAHEVDEFREATGEEALWTGSMFSGMPAYQISVKWTANLLSYADKVFHGFLPRPANFLFLYLMGMFVLLRILKVDPWLSVVGAIAFAFSSYFFVILPAGHTSKANAIGYMPMVLGGLYLLYRGRMILGAALLGLFLGLQIMQNHLQVTYYLAILLVLFVLAELMRSIREKQLVDFAKRSSLGAIAAGLAVLCNLGVLWSTMEYGKYSTRGKSEVTIQPDGSSAEGIRTTGLDRDYVTMYSYGKQESFTLLVPDAKGGFSSMIGNGPELAGADQRYRQNLAQMNRYWGDQMSTSGPQYAGVIVVLLMLMMLMQAEGRDRWWLLGSLLVILLQVMINNAAPYDPEVAASYVGGIKASLLAGGVIILFIAAGLFLMRDGLTYALFSSLLLTLMLSWGRNLMPLTDFFLEYVPGYDKFRAVTIILVIVELAAPVLAILYLDRLVRNGGWDKVMEKRSLIAMASVLLVLLSMGLAPDTFFNFVSDQEKEMLSRQAEDSPAMEAQVRVFVDELKSVRIGIFTGDVWRSFAFVVAAGALVYFFGRKKIGKPVLLAGIGTLLLLDQWTVDKRYMNNEKEKGRLVQWVDEEEFKRPYRPDAADKAILEAEWSPEAEAEHKTRMARLKESGEKFIKPDVDLAERFSSLRRHADYRVLTLSDPFSNGRISYFHKSVGGYHGAKLKRYQELIEFHLYPAMERVGGLLQSGTSLPQIDSLLADEKVLNMLNTRYLIYNPERPPIRNTNAYGVGWFVDELKWAKNSDDEIIELGKIDPATTAVVDERYRAQLGGAEAIADPSASVELTRYETNELTYTVRSQKGGVVVFSEVWYGPDWHATIDGEPAEHVRADYVLRAMAVPGGEHTVVFKIDSKPYNTSRPIAMASSALLIILVLGALGWEWRTSQPAE